jgi:hypothetical protein
MGTVMAHLRESVPRPGRFNRDLSLDVENVILKSLAKDRENRFENVSELNKAYQAALAGKVVPEFDLPPETLVPGRERRLTAPTRPRVAFPEEFPKPRRRTGWILITVLVAIVAAGVLYFFGPSLFNLTGSGLPSGNPSVEATNGGPEQTAIPTRALSSATPMPTPIPPITSADCPGFSLHSPIESGNNVEWILDNDTGAPLSVQRIQNISWDIVAKGTLQGIKLGEDVIWQGVLTIDELDQLLVWDMTRDANTTIEPGFPTKLTLMFQFDDPINSPYELGIVLDDGCILAGAWQ